MDALSAWREWRAYLRVESSPDTVRNYLSPVLWFVADADERPVEDYTEGDCVAFLDSHARRGAARHQYAKALRSYFGFCVRRGWAERNPMDGVHLRKPRRLPPVTLTGEELTRLLVASVFIHGQRTAWCILLIYVLGLRRIEAAGLRWEHIRDGESGPVIEVREAKGGSERAAVPLSPLALECLARIRELPAPRAQRDEGYILRAGRGTISGWVHDAGVAAGLPPRKIGAHRLRATFATGLLREGVDVTVVQRLLGHLRLESTAYYLGWAEEDLMRDGIGRLPVAV